MGLCLVMPVGVTGETVSELLRRVEPPSCIVSVTIPGFEGEKEKIRDANESLARMLGAKHFWVVVRPWIARDVVRILECVEEAEADRLLVVTMTGSRYLYLVLLEVALFYWRTGVEVSVIHGVEGGDYRIEPLAGYVAPCLRLTREQEKLLLLIYSTDKVLSGSRLMKEYGYSKVVYKLLSELEQKGLLRVRRNRIEKTFPGYILYEIIKHARGE